MTQKGPKGEPKGAKSEQKKVAALLGIRQTILGATFHQKSMKKRCEIDAEKVMKNHKQLCNK